MRETQKKIKELRVSAGLTQQELAQRLGMKQQAIARLELAEKSVSLDTFERVLGVLDHQIAIVPVTTATGAQPPETTDKKN